MDEKPCCDDHLREWSVRRDILAMQVLAPLSTSYLPWSISAMRPSGVVKVLNEIVLNQRRHIVELGGGVSTCYIGRLLRQRGGRLYTVEHDDRWAEVLEQTLAAEGLGDVVTVVRAPLAPVSPTWPGADTAWYDRDAIREAVAGRPIDLLVIDGPPAYQAGLEHSRYPAIPFFAPMLADDYAVVLDDIDRPGEQDIMRDWEQRLGIAFERRLVGGGVGIGRSRAAFTT